MKALLKAITPKPVLQFVQIKQETRLLAKLERRPCDASTLRSKVPDFPHLDLGTEWDSVQREIEPLQMGDEGGAVNLGDRRAIYYLTRALKTQTVLEIGTHLGASTTMFGLALKNSGIRSPKVVTVDIQDVNGTAGAWGRLGSKHSPLSATRALGCDFVEFVISPSVAFLNKCSMRFDLIFLDGGHEASTVYQEVPAALKLLNPGGLILLHDIYPDQRPLWSDGLVVPGPWLAIERFKKEGAKVTVKPLGALPWPTKLNSNVTSLACLIGTTATKIPN